MRLLQADLLAVVNAPRFSSGRPVFLGSAVTLATLAGLSAMIGLTLTEVPWPALPPGRTDLALAVLTAPSILVALWFGLSASQRQLFESRTLDLMLAGPTTPTRLVLHVFLRVWLLTTLYSLALLGPVDWCILGALDFTGPGRLALLPAVMLATGPLLALVMAAHILLLRFLAGRVMKVLVRIAIGALSMTFGLLILTGAFAVQGTQVRELAELVRDPPEQLLPLPVAGAGQLLALCNGVGWQHDVLLRSLGLLTLGVIVLYFAGLGHPRAVENHRESDAPRRRARRRRGWPGSVGASVRHKELAHLLQHPRQLVGMLLFAAVLFVLANRGFVIGAVLRVERLPEPVRRVTAMAILWSIGALMTLPANFGRLALFDGNQWPLLMAAPVRPWSLLAGKLAMLALLLAWPWLVVTALGFTLLDCGPGEAAVFTALAGAGILVALSIVAVSGTLPVCTRPDEEGIIHHGGRTLIAVLVMVLAFEFLLLVPGSVAWFVLARSYEQGAAWTPGQVAGPVIAAAWAAALLAAAVALPWAARNYRVLLRPR